MMKNSGLKILFCAISIAFTNCKDVSNNSQINNDFTIESVKQGFETNSISGWPEYHFTGTITNNTGNIYNDATVFMYVIFRLDNGKELTDMTDHENGGRFSFAGVESLESIKMFESHQTVKMDEMISADINPTYRKYPIKSVHLRFKIKKRDDVNSTEDESFLSEIDITEAWQAIQKPKHKKADVESTLLQTESTHDNGKVKVINLPTSPNDISYNVVQKSDAFNHNDPIQKGVIQEIGETNGSKIVTICFLDKTANYQTDGYILDAISIDDNFSSGIDESVFCPGRCVEFQVTWLGTSAGHDALTYIKALPSSTIKMPDSIKISKHIYGSY